VRSRWYFYQKTKNYRVLWGGIKGGLKTGTRLALWTGAFVGLEEGIEIGARRLVPDIATPTRWASGAIAGLTIAALAGRFCSFRSSRDVWRTLTSKPPRLQIGCRNMAEREGSC
jgi:hypothetical protein